VADEVITRVGDQILTGGGHGTEPDAHRQPDSGAQRRWRPVQPDLVVSGDAELTAALIDEAGWCRFPGMEHGPRALVSAVQSAGGRVGRDSAAGLIETPVQDEAARPRSHGVYRQQIATDLDRWLHILGRAEVGGGITADLAPRPAGAVAAPRPVPAGAVAAPGPVPAGAVAAPGPVPAGAVAATRTHPAGGGAPCAPGFSPGTTDRRLVA
jgi:hypothetical protein